MAVVNPYSDDPDRGAAWEQGYEAGYAEPECEHFPPLEGELLDVFRDGEQLGRDDRSKEPAAQDPFPSADSPEVTRFETAPDGMIVPIPDEVPPGNRIREDATVTVQPMSSGGYYVAIYNGPPEGRNPETEHLIHEALTERVIVTFERFIANAVYEGAHQLVKWGGVVVSVAISAFTPSPILKETRFRGYLEDGTPIWYVVLDPQE